MVTIKNNTSNAFVANVSNPTNLDLLIILNPGSTLVYKISDRRKTLLSLRTSSSAAAT